MTTHDEVRELIRYVEGSNNVSFKCTFCSEPLSLLSATVSSRMKIDQAQGFLDQVVMVCPKCAALRFFSLPLLRALAEGTYPPDSDGT